MKHSTGKPTKAEAARMARLKVMPCVSCVIAFGRFETCGPTEVHHLLSGNKRRGHMFTIPLGRWHHQGIPPKDMSAVTATRVFGPSLAKQSKKFRELYGNDDFLLEQVNKQLGELR